LPQGVAFGTGTPGVMAFKGKPERFVAYGN
jgi:hypothetical protein